MNTEVEIVQLEQLGRCLCGRCFGRKRPCAYCGQAFNDQRNYCPRCGYPNNSTALNKKEEQSE